VPPVKYRLEDLGEPRRLGKSYGFGFGDESQLQHFRFICAGHADSVRGFEDSHHVRSAISVPVADDELGPAEDADQAGEPNGQPGLLEHLANGGIRRGFERLDGAAREKPDVSLDMTRQQDVSVGIAERDCDRRKLEQLLTANQLAKPSHVLSHGRHPITPGAESPDGLASSLSGPGLKACRPRA
jgi:hypothetical protein